MFTHKWVGMTTEDASSEYTYGSLPTKPELGHIIVFEKSGNRYAVTRIAGGEGLVGDDGYISQKELAWAEINQGETVPTLWLQLLREEVKATSRSFSYEELKEQSQKNREARLSHSALAMEAKSEKHGPDSNERERER